MVGCLVVGVFWVAWGRWGSRTTHDERPPHPQVTSLGKPGIPSRRLGASRLFGAGVREARGKHRRHMAGLESKKGKRWERTFVEGPKATINVFFPVYTHIL